MKTIPFNGHVSEMRADNIWLAAEDLDGRGDVPVTILEVKYNEQIEFEQGRKENKYSIKFKEAKKELILNATNRRMLVGLFGGMTEKWIGKKITLYIKDGIKAFGGVTRGVRIKP